MQQKCSGFYNRDFLNILQEMFKLLLLGLLATPLCLSVEECKDNKCSVESKSSCGCKTNRLPGSGKTNGEEEAQAAPEHDPLAAVDLDLVERTNQMALIDGGTFVMGSDLPILLQDGEAPARRVKMSSFFLDVHETSNAEFARFVRDTGHRTEAETFGDSFVMDYYLTNQTLSTVTQAVKDAPWWVPVKGADWRRPEGPDSDLEGKLDHPVVHVSWNDAKASFLIFLL